MDLDERQYCVAVQLWSILNSSAITLNGGRVRVELIVVWFACWLCFLGIRNKLGFTHPAFTCLKLTIETLEQGMKYVQS